jgi:hypothetical protein
MRGGLRNWYAEFIAELQIGVNLEPAIDLDRQKVATGK